MGTGTGKTFIAIMLIRWMAAMPATDNFHRIIVFLVPKVALVDQQFQAIAANTSLRVRQYCGDMEVDFWNRERWIKEFESTDVVVMTAEIWRSVLNHAYWTLDRVLLMVFDECHHTAKKHPYNLIMQRYHEYTAERFPLQTIPRILGLTASAIYNPKNPDKAFKELETRLDASIVNIGGDGAEVDGYIHKAIERSEYYTQEGPPPLQTDFEVMLDEIEIWEYVDQEKIFQRIENIKRTLGTLACDVYIMNWLGQLRNPVATASSLQNIRASGRINEVEILYMKMKRIIDAKLYYGVGDVSEKVRVLVKLLATYRAKQGFCTIIFTEQRHHAMALATILSKSQTLQGFIRPGHLVGHGGSGAERLASEGLNAQAQRRIVEDFRLGKLNLLVATSVAEEGLDFPACNLIVRFDVMATYIGYIQSRGRARCRNSEFVVLVEKGSKDENRWREYVNAEPLLEKKYEEPTTLEEEIDLEMQNTPVYRVVETGATLTYDSAIALLTETCSLVPTDAYSPPSKPDYDTNSVGRHLFVTKIFLPMMPLLPADQRLIVGPESGTKKGSRQAAAFDACKMFHHLGILDDYLLPLREGRGDMARDADDNPLDRTVLPTHIEVNVKNIFGNIWSSTKPDIWLNEIRFRNKDDHIERLGLICAEPLNLQDSITLHEPGLAYQLTVKPYCLLNWDEPERHTNLARLDKFTRWAITQTINRKLIKGPLVYLLAPLTSSASRTVIDWLAVEAPYSDLESSESVNRGDLLIAPWKFMRQHIFTVQEIRTDLNIVNMPRVTGLTKRGRIYERTNNFGDALSALLDYENVSVQDLDSTLSILHLIPCFQIRNNLNPIKEYKQATQVKSAAPHAVPLGNPSHKIPGFSISDEAEEAYFSALPSWELPDWKWRQYNIAQHETDEEANDLLDPESSVTKLDPLPSGKTASASGPMLNAFALPWTLCKRSNITIGFWRAFSWLPSLVRAIEDRARTQQALSELSITGIRLELAEQALTLPLCCTGKDYQTLETIGDSALKLAVTVVVYNKFVAKDEGGLSIRRMNSIDNQHLRMKAFKKDLQRHLLTDFLRNRTWTPATLENGAMHDNGLGMRKAVPRRALSDCVESLLGAAYLSGGFDSVLRVGHALGLCFGGTVPWSERYQLSPNIRALPVGRGLIKLEEQLGYKFKHGQLLVQAITHRSFARATTYCQEREEFLGDAVLDNFVIDRLSRKFPSATPSHLTRLRSTLVSNSALGYLSLVVLKLHRFLLHSTPLLDEHFARAISEAETYIQDDFVNDIWLFDPPKPAADAIEGIIGAIFVDSGWQLEPVFDVLDRVFAGMFELLPHKESAPRDPSTRLRLYLHRQQCKDFELQTAARGDVSQQATVTVGWHNQVLAKVTHHSQASARQLACKIALGTLTKHGEKIMQVYCTCRDDLGERTGSLECWRKDVEQSLTLSKDIDPGTKIPTSGDLRSRFDDAQEIENWIYEDLGRRDELESQAKEAQLEAIMTDTFGYNPDRIAFEGLLTEAEDEYACVLVITRSGVLPQRGTVQSGLFEGEGKIHLASRDVP